MSAAAGLDQPRSPAGFIHAIAAGVVGWVVAVFGLDGLPLWLQLVIVVATIAVTYWAVPTLWTAVVAIDAPLRQRDEARAALVAERQRAEERERELAAQAEIHIERIGAAEGELETVRRLMRSWADLRAALEWGESQKKVYSGGGLPPVPGSYAGSSDVYTQYEIWREQIATALVHAGFEEAAASFPPASISRPREEAPEALVRGYEADVQRLRELLSPTGDLHRALFGAQ